MTGSDARDSNRVRPDSDTLIDGMGLGDGAVAGKRLPVLMFLNDDSRKNEPFVVREEEYKLGRDRVNHLILNKGNVSRQHAVIRLENLDSPSKAPKCTLVDCGSRNGTFLNGKKVQESRSLNHGDIIGIGGFTLRYLVLLEDEIKARKGISEKSRGRGGQESVPVNAEVTLRILIPEDTFTPFSVAGHALDINLHGMMIESGDLAPELVESLLKTERYVRLSLPTNGAALGDLNLFGYVAWVDSRIVDDAPVYSLGVQFEDLPEPVSRGLLAFLDKQLGDAPESS